MHIDGVHILVQVFLPLRARNGYDVTALGQHPSQRELRCLDAFARSHLFHLFDQRKIAVEVSTLEARRVAAEIVGCEVFEAFYLSSEEATAQGRVSDKTDAQFAHSRQDLVLRL